jgi:hypothetical protein
MKKHYIKIFTVLFASTLLLSACNKSDGNTTQADSKSVSEITVTPTAEVSSNDQEVTPEPTELAMKPTVEATNPDTDFESVYDTDLPGIAIKYIGSSNKVRFPSTINGDPVVAIYQPKTPEVIEEVYIPEGIKVIGSRAFEGCTELTSVSIPEGVTNIGNSAFNGCTKLASVSIPNSVTAIEQFAFGGCIALTSVNIPDSLEFIDIDHNPFEECARLTEIKVGASNTTYADVDGVLFDKALTKLIFCPKGKQGTYTIPASVTEIVQDAFTDCTELTDVSIPNGVQSINFSGCISLASVTVPDSVTDVNFVGCTSLADIALSDNVTIMYFEGCTALKNVNIPKGVKEISPSAFKNCTGLKNVTLPKGLTSIRSEAFYGCTSLDTITIPSNVQEIAEDSFQGCPFEWATWAPIFEINGNTKTDI